MFATLAFAGGVPLWAQDPATTDQEQPTSDETTQEAAQPLLLADIATERIELQKRSLEIRRRLEGREDLDALGDQLSDFETQLEPILEKTNAESVQQIPLSELMVMSSTVLTIESPLTKLTQELDAQTRSLGSELADLKQLSQRWSDLSEATESLRAPKGMVNEVQEAQNEISELIPLVESRRNEALNLLARAAGLSSKVADSHSRASDYQRRAQRETLLSEGRPLWQLHWQESGDRLFPDLWLQLKAEARSVASYVQVNSFRILATFLIPLGLTLFWLHRLKIPAQEMADDDPDAARALQVIDPSWPIALILSLLVTIWLSPLAPPVYYQTLLFILPVPAAIFVLRTHGTSIRISVVALAIALALLALRSLLELSPLLDRIILIGQCAAVGAALVWDLRHGNWLPALSGRWEKPDRWVLKIASGSLFVTAVLAVAGQVGLARAARTGILMSLGFALIYGGLFRALDSLTKTWIRTPSARSRPMVRNYPDRIALYIRRILFLLALGGWIGTTLYAFNVYTQAIVLLKRILNSGLKAGAVDITLGDVLLFTALIFLTVFLARFVRLFLEEELLPKFHLNRGLPYAISTVTRYIILVVGFWIAMGAVGIDFSKATLLAGALGVGIGFGLQNVVNNFVSGLILLFERPVQVGDAIEVGNLIGEVTNIGIRASTVRTFQGAEVIVPNGELISTQVVNWTFSNRRRRVEIVVGVAYGTDPQRVIRLLLDTAKAHPRVDDEPKPSVIFSDFGDSSLDFQLRCWVNIFEEGLNVGSELRVAIDQALKEAGIEIPFPQRDLHIRSNETDRPRQLEISEESATE